MYSNPLHHIPIHSSQHVKPNKCLCRADSKTDRQLILSKVESTVSYLGLKPLIVSRRQTRRREGEREREREREREQKTEMLIG